MYSLPVPLAVLDALAYASVWVGAAAGALCTAASLALGVSPDPAAIGVAVAGTVVVYNVDRLRDLARDRATSPRRSAFVDAHAGRLRALTAVAALASAACAVRLGGRAVLVLLPVLAVGLAHRRLKGVPVLKPTYITAAWIAVVVGLPAVASPGAENAAWVAAVLAAAIFANAVASNVRDRELAVAWIGPARALGAARSCAGLGALLALAAPPPVRPLVAVPALTLAALARGRMTERYGLVVVDGALPLGAVVAIVWLQL